LLYRAPEIRAATVRERNFCYGTEPGITHSMTGTRNKVRASITVPLPNGRGSVSVRLYLLYRAPEIRAATVRERNFC
ncbi:hypothetical protein Lsha_2118, partial [Legionella shakespearei DSM 23087]